MGAGRHLGRDPGHRRAVLRNLVTSLIEHESITTTHTKAKEAQKLAEKLIASTKRSNQKGAKIVAQGELFNADFTVPKLFGVLKQRYAERNSGYTRILHLEPRLSDRAPQSILELVDGPKELKFWMTARIVARLQQQGLPIDPLTQQNIDKLTKYRSNGVEEFNNLVEKLKLEFYSDSKILEELKENLPSEKIQKGVHPRKSGNKPYTLVPRPESLSEAAETNTP